MPWGRAARNAKVLHHYTALRVVFGGAVMWSCERSAKGVIPVTDADRALLRCFECCRITGTEYGVGAPSGKAEGR